MLAEHWTYPALVPWGRLTVTEKQKAISIRVRFGGERVEHRLVQPWHGKFIITVAGTFEDGLRKVPLDGGPGDNGTDQSGAPAA